MVDQFFRGWQLDRQPVFQLATVIFSIEFRHDRDANNRQIVACGDEHVLITSFDIIEYGLPRGPARCRISLLVESVLEPFVCGAAPPKVDGVSLMPLLRGGSLAPRLLFWHYPHYSNQGGEPASAIRDGDWKLIHFLVDGRRELYNLREDAGEKANLIHRHPAVADRLYARLDAWRKETGAIMPRKNPSADPQWPGFGLTGEEKPTPPAVPLPKR